MARCEFNGKYSYIFGEKAENSITNGNKTDFSNIKR